MEEWDAELQESESGPETGRRQSPPPVKYLNDKLLDNI